MFIYSWGVGELGSCGGNSELEFRESREPREGRQDHNLRVD